jgi:hypothetical protein
VIDSVKRLPKKSELLWPNSFLRQSVPHVKDAACGLIRWRFG